MTTTGDMIMIFGAHTTSTADSTTLCKATNHNDGTTAGASNIVTGGLGARPIILGQCYETRGAGVTGTSSDIALSTEFTHQAGSADEESVGFIKDNATEVKWQINATTTTAVEMVPYTGTADGCASGNQTPELGTTLSNGWQCKTGSAMGMGILNATTNGTAAVIPGVKYLTVKLDNNNTNAGVRECTSAAGITVATGTYVTTPGINIDYWPVCLTAADCKPGICSVANTAAAFTGNATSCLAATGTPTFGALAGDKTDAAALSAALCTPNTAAHAGASQLGCDRETGRMIRNWDHNTAQCSGFSYAAPYTGTGSPVIQILHKENMAIYTATDLAGTTGLDNDKTICVQNTAAEFEGICDMQKFGGTAKKYFIGYLNDTQGDCATYGGAITIAPEEHDATRAVFLDVCYAMNPAAGSAGRWSGWAGPFNTNAGTDTIITAGAYGSKMFKENGAEIEIWNYTTHDCSGTVVKVTSDDPADSWCQTPAAISHGNVGTTGNAVAALQTATTFLQVRQHVDATSAGIGLPGTCKNGSSVDDLSKAGVTGNISDYFLVNQGLGNSPATGCHQMEKASAANTGDAQSYAWWCDTSDASIYYAKFFDQTCSSTKMLAEALRFTKFAYTTCAESSASAGYDAGNTTCTAAGPTFTTAATATTDNATQTLEGPADFVFSNTTGHTAIAFGTATQFGGRCLQSAANTSWELVVTDAEYDALCSVPSPAASSEDAAASSAAKVAATAAAAAAAAILL